MTLSELLNEVYLLTKRPDKVTETTSAIKTAALKMHGKDFYSKDIVETGVVFSSSDTLQSLVYKSLFPRWRAVSYIQPLDSITFLPTGLPLTEINPQFSVDSYYAFKNNVYYEAGQILQIHTLPAFQYFGIGYYSFPDLTALETSWISQDFPYALIYDAAATVFKGLGFAEQESSMRALVGEQSQLITISNVGATGS